MADSKCFCHFGEYEVKDAKARAAIEQMKSDYKAPTVEIKNGYWVINGVNTGVLAQVESSSGGSGGYTSNLSVNSEGYLVIGGETTALNINGNSGPKGDKGDGGEDGITPQFKIQDGYLMVSYEEGVWNILGDKIVPTIEINEDDYWVINGVVSDVKARGENGKDADLVDGAVVLYKNRLAFRVYKKQVVNGEKLDAIDYLEPYVWLKLTFLTLTESNIIERLGYTYTSGMTFGNADSITTAYTFLRKLANFRDEHGHPILIEGEVSAWDAPEGYFTSVYSYASDKMLTNLVVHYKEDFTATGTKYVNIGTYSDLMITSVECTVNRLM